MIDAPGCMCGMASLHKVEHRREVGRERVVPLLVGDLVERSWLIWKAALLTRTSTRPNSSTAFGMIVLAVRAVGEVAGHQHAPAAGLLDVARGVLRVLVLVQVGDQDVGALAGEGDRDGPADAAVAAGDDRGLAGQPPRAAVALLAVVGLRGPSPRARRAGSCCWAGWDSGRGSDTGPPARVAARTSPPALPRTRRTGHLHGNDRPRRARCSHDDRDRHSPARRRGRPVRPAREGRRPRRAVRLLRRLGRGERHRAVPGAGGGADRTGQRRERRPGDADRLGQVAGGHRRAVRGAGSRTAQLLHRADQGAGQREVLRPLRRLRRGQRRHAHRRRGGQRAGRRSSPAPRRCWPTSRCARAPTPTSASW